MREWKDSPLIDYTIRTIEDQLVRCLELDHFQGVAVWGEIHLNLMDALEDQ